MVNFAIRKLETEVIDWAGRYLAEISLSDLAINQELSIEVSDQEGTREI